MVVATILTIILKLKRSTRKERNAKTEAEEEGDFPVHLLTYLKNILLSVFSDFEVYTNIQQKFNPHGLYAQKSCFSENFNEAKSDYRGVS